MATISLVLFLALFFPVAMFLAVVLPESIWTVLSALAVILIAVGFVSSVSSNPVGAFVLLAAGGIYVSSGVCNLPGNNGSTTPASNIQIPTATPVISQVLSPGDKPLSISWTEGASYQIEASEGLMMKLPDITFGGNISIDEPITINWGDGIEDGWLLTKGQRTLTDLNHRYDQNGDYSGYIRATDIQGEQTTMQFVTKVLNVAPQVINVITPKVYLDTETVFEIQIEDPGLLDSHVIAIEWGDGSGAKTYEMRPGETTIELSHTFAFDSGGEPYSGSIVVDDNDGGRVTTVFNVLLVESFVIPGYRSDWADWRRDAWTDCGGVKGKNTLEHPIRSPGPSAEIGYSGDKSIVIGLPGIGLHLLFDQTNREACKEHYFFPLDLQDDHSIWSEKSALNPGMNLRAGTLLDDHQRIFVLGHFGDEPWSRPAIYHIGTDEWVYPRSAVTSYRLSQPTLTSLDDSTVLIVGGLKCHPRSECEVYDSGEIFDPETNTFKSLGINPMMLLLKELGYPLVPYIHTVKLEDGRVLIVSSSGGGLLSVFDPATEEFYLVEPEKQVIGNDGGFLGSKEFICDVQPILLQGGEIFLGGSLLSADLKTMEYLNTNECRLTDDEPFRLVGSTQIKLDDGRILLVGKAGPLKSNPERLTYRGAAWIFDGSAYIKTIYQPCFSRTDPYLFFDSWGDIVVFGGMRLEDPSSIACWDLLGRSVGATGKEMERFVTAPPSQ